MNFAEIGSVALRPSAWLTGTRARRNAVNVAGKHPVEASQYSGRVAIDAAPAEVPHHFWHGLMFALPFGLAFWAGVWFLFLA